MKKLDEIPKKDVFKVPDGYFDRLPSVIQSRVIDSSQKRTFVLSWSAAWKYALPAVILIAVTVFWFMPSDPELAADLLAGIETEDLIAYLNESDISIDEVVSAGEFNAEDLEEIEGEVFNLGLDDMDLQNPGDADNLDLDNSDLENLINESDGTNL